MKRIFSILFAVVLVLSFSLIPAAPVMANGAPSVTLDIPENVYRPVTFDASSTTTNPAGVTTYTNVRFNITVSGPEAFTGAREDIFTITQVVPGGVQGINETFVLVGGDFVGYWGPVGGFPLPAGYSGSSTFTVQMNDGGTAPLGDYEVTVALVDLTPEPDVTLASATDGFSLSADTLYVGTGQQFTTIQAAVDAASAGDTIIVAEGTYTEDVVVNKNVTLQSAKKHKAEVVGSFDFTGTADGATLDGFHVRMTITSDGIHAHQVDGLTIRNNKVTGVGPFTAWKVPAPHAGISVILCDDATIEKNNIRNTTGVGIWFGSSTNSLISKNRISDTQYTGILLPNWEGQGPSNGNLIAENRVKNSGNTLWVYDDGIRLGAGAHNNVVWGNHVTGAIRSGIRAVSSTCANTIVGNKMRDSQGLGGGFDAHDMSSGARTAGTANWWAGNKGKTESPTGLLK